MTLLVTILQAVQAVFAYLAQRNRQSRIEECENGNSRREHSLLLKALRARRKARQRHFAEKSADAKLRPDHPFKNAIPGQSPGKADEM